MKVFYGTVVNSNKETPLKVSENCAVGYDNGKIVFVEETSNLDDIIQQFDVDLSDVYRLNKFQFLMPGFVDTHVHASQYPNAAAGLGLPLLEWLSEYTFPLEAKFKHIEFATEAAKKVVNQTLRKGTTTAVYYVTIHPEAALKMCDVAEEYGQRAIVGKVCMDANSPSYYCETTEESIKSTEYFISQTLSRQYKLVSPAVTPRFALSCSSQLMQQLAQIARNYDVPVQTHISESKRECELVKETFPECESYVDVYDKMGLLHDKTLLAHGIHLSDKEIQVIKERGASILHCPVSNLCLRSGLCDVRRLLDSGIKVGLGTDVSGGYDLSMLTAVRTAVQMSTAISFNKPESYRILSHQEAFYLATLGGAEAVGLGEKTGNFQVGKDLDALLINMAIEGGAVDTFSHDDSQRLVDKFLMIGDDRNIERVYVAGKQVVPFQ